MQLDSDTIFLDEPDFACGEHELLARPVDVAGMCSTGPTDSREPLWQTMCEANRVKIEDLGFVIPSVTGAPVRSSYNAGLIVAPRHVFRVIEECFLNIVRAGVRPYAGHLSSLRSGAEVVGAAGAEMWGTSQAAIAIASAKELKSVRLLDLGYNVPLHLIDELNPLPKSIMHLHYHWLFEEGERNPLFDGRVSLPPDKADWLKERLPLGTADRGFGRSGTMRRIMARLKSWL